MRDIIFLMSEHPPAAVGQAVREALVAAGTSQVALAQQLQLSRAAITRRIAGEVEFTASQISVVSDLTGVREQDLLRPAER